MPWRDARELVRAAARVGLVLDEREVEKLLRKWAEEDEEARRIRRENADWDFIERQEERVRAALKFLVETGDLRTAAKLAGVSVGEMDRLRMKAGIPIVV